MNQPDLTLTYAESEQHAPFDWNAFLAQDPKTITEEAWNKADRLSGDWVSCACGNQCAVIPRHPIGGPKDLKLFELGLIFSDEINHRALEDARETLRQIEQRTAYLLSLPDYTDHKAGQSS